VFKQRTKKRKRGLALVEFAEKAREFHGLVEGCQKEALKSAQNVLRNAQVAGEYLARAKAYLRKMKKKGYKIKGEPAPSFEDWVPLNCGFSYETAQIYIRVHQNWPKLQLVVNGPLPPVSLRSAMRVIRRARKEEREARKEEQQANANGTAKENQNLKPSGPTEEEQRAQIIELRRCLIQTVGDQLRKEVRTWDTSALLYLAGPPARLTEVLRDLYRRIGPAGAILHRASERHPTSVDSSVAALQEAQTIWSRLTPEQRGLLLVETEDAKDSPDGGQLYTQLTAHVKDPVETPVKGKWPDGTRATAHWWN
jgi:hypothetical protein